MSHITTCSGRQFDFDAPTFDVRDIAWALSNICRFNGHCSSRWTVLQHSLACMFAAPPALKREALLHDATEAYLCDIPTPLKLILPDYQVLESRIDAAMREHFGLQSVMPNLVHQIDYDMLIAEAAVYHLSLWVELGRPRPQPYASNAVARANGYDGYNARSLFISFA
jgi:hypothetical protein